MDASDTIFAVLHAAGTIPSRTMLQKLVYLAATEEERTSLFAPYFYGPYSADLQETVEELTVAGLIEETATQLEPWEPTPFDIVRYSYRLTPLGESGVEDVPVETIQRAARVVHGAREAGAWNQASLSMAAKLHHLRQVDPDLGDDNVPALARQFGWRMTEASARQGARLLALLSERGR
jgi:hypothetical protein